ncbi:MAG: DNA-protecting protein DprA [Pirellulaceae bacterium]|nr:DNA-protecting protein DprA [Pirellulaceae bacterium]
MDECESAERCAEAQLRHGLRLAMIPGIGPRIRQALLEKFSTAEGILSAPMDRLRQVAGVGPKLARAITMAGREIDVEGEIAVCRQRGVQILADWEADYPPLLKEIDDPPGILFVRGGLRPIDRLAVAIVGTRHATHYGLRQAERLAGGLARAGVTIVSGLARGIDAAAHRGALAAGGRTLAVLGSGVLHIYPPEHGRLAEEVIQQGALVSESPPRAAPRTGSFPQRNRIISGLSLGTVIVEAGQRSGALITARLAGEQNREVFAVPGRVEDRAAQGCHRLLREGATLVETVDDILDQLGPLANTARRDDGSEVRHPAELMLNELEHQVLAAVGGDPTSMDQLVAKTGLPIARILSTVSVLEMRRLVRRVTGASVVRV